MPRRKKKDPFYIQIINNRDFRYWTLLIMFLLIGMLKDWALFYLWIGFGLARGFKA